jgi:PLP dependent protein
MPLIQRIKHIRHLINQAEQSAHRSPQSVLLLAVTKQQPTELIREAYTLGIHDFAESYVQEAKEKIHNLQELNICWHFIGPIQSNKIKVIASYFDWVHSIDKQKSALLLNQYRQINKMPINVCLQVNCVNEASKSGVSPEAVRDLAAFVAKLPNLKLRGLMTIPPPMHNEIEQFNIFQNLKSLMLTTNKQLKLNMDTLSMGMSDDMIPAIKAGATQVRIGRALFGDRD